jgi:hypothetical protein
MRKQIVLAFFVIASPLFAADCPVTRPPNPLFVPPQPSSEARPGLDFAYGSDALWTLLESSGVWQTLRQKVWMWSNAFDRRAEPEPLLVVTGRRLDGNSPPFRNQRATHGGFADGTSALLAGVDIPSAGCWEITSQYRGNTLSFVVSVQP